MIDEEALDRALNYAMDNPMPNELRNKIALEIEPHTMNVEIEHDEVMTAIDIAFPLIRDFLQEIWE